MPLSPTCDVTVIVVTHDNEDLIERCLRSTMRGVGDLSHEVIVVDNASTDDTCRRAADAGVGARVIALPDNRGFAVANNVALSEAQGTYAVLVNSDAFPDPGSIGELVDAARRHPRAAIIGGRLRYASGHPQPSAGRFPSLLGGLWVALFLHHAPVFRRLPIAVFVDKSFYRSARRVDWVLGAFCLATREAGTLPTRAFMFGEDVEWCHEAIERGLEVWIEPRATAIHLLGATVSRSQPPGFGYAARVDSELRWFAHRGPLIRALVRATWALNALVRLALVPVFAVARRSSPAETARPWVTQLRRALRG